MGLSSQQIRFEVKKTKLSQNCKRNMWATAITKYNFW